jgi:hypothetical protein
MVLRLRLEDEQGAFIGLHGEAQLDLFAVSRKRYGGDLVAHGIPAFGHAFGGDAEAEGARAALAVLVGDEEYITAFLDTVQHVQPVVGRAREHFEVRVNTRMARQSNL